MSNSNPFNISFGKVTTRPIDREKDFSEIYTSFTSPTPQSNIYIVTGPMGSGKTISLSIIKNDFASKEGWIIVNINSNMDILEQLASGIYESGVAKKLFVKKEFDFSFSGISISIKGEKPVSSVSVLLEKIFEYLKRKGVRVLVLIDEVSNNEYMKVFAQSFQILIRENYDIYSVMTGLYENISDLQDEKTLTFLYRAPKINLSPLNIRAITMSYSEIFNIEQMKALELAKLTKGFAFAYQLLGYILFEENKTEVDKKVLNRFDLLLDERIYSKIYSEMTEREKDIIKAASVSESMSNVDIENRLGIKQNSLSVYKKRLNNKGIISLNERGKISFSLPRFKEFLQFKIAEES